MAIITDVKPQQKNANRSNLYLDGKFYCGIETITLLAERIEIGDEIDERQLIELLRKSEGVTAFDKAVKYVNRRMRAESEVRTYLREKGYIAEVIDDVILKLAEYKYVNDENFVRAYINEYRAKKGYKAIRYELLRLKIDKEIIDEILLEQEPQTEEALRIARKYLKTHDYKKVLPYLLSKGFDYETALSATRTAQEEQDE